MRLCHLALYVCVTTAFGCDEANDPEPGGQAGTGGEAGMGGEAGTGASLGGSPGTGGGMSVISSPYADTQFFAVDLPNFDDGADDPSWGVAVLSAAAPGCASSGCDTGADVTISVNESPPGQAPDWRSLETFSLAPQEGRFVELPSREVTGRSPSSPEGSMTQRSGNLVRISSKGRVFVAQLSGTATDATAEATMLFPNPESASHEPESEERYHVVSAPAAASGYNSITVVANAKGAAFEVVPTAEIEGDGLTLGPWPPGQSAAFALSPFEVLNLAAAGDLTGTVLQGSDIASVFTSAQGVVIPGTLESGPPPVPGSEGSTCCSDHLQEQLLPLRAWETGMNPTPPVGWGTDFIVPSSPSRSETASREPDLIRIVAGQSSAGITTSLPAPHQAFALAPGEHADIWTTQDTYIRSSAPISVAQILVGSGYTTSGKGDPSLLMIPPVDEYRESAWIYVPEGWPEVYVTHVTRSPSPDHGTHCTTTTLEYPADAVHYVHVCEAECTGWCLVESTSAMVVMVHGYSQASSFAMQGAGFDVTLLI